MSFLKAEWRKLAIANYAVAKTDLEKYLPAHTELDLWNDTCYVSLVGFMFTNVRVLGIPVPFHRNFEEVNLRFYVRHKHNNEWRRGVVFVKELVPKRAITWVANTIYKEHYQTVKMDHHWKTIGNLLDVQYTWNSKAGKQNRFRVLADSQQRELVADSETEFITEHFWGYTRIDAAKTTEYEVRHPQWNVYDVQSYETEVDFGAVYGSDFEFLNQLKPVSVMLAEGSPISVENKRSL